MESNAKKKRLKQKSIIAFFKPSTNPSTSTSEYFSTPVRKPIKHPAVTRLNPPMRPAVIVPHRNVINSVKQEPSVVTIDDDDDLFLASTSFCDSSISSGAANSATPKYRVSYADSATESSSEIFTVFKDVEAQKKVNPPIPPGFDMKCAEHWVYPTNYARRKYQSEIVRSCLFDNTMVVIPTGTGKTFIAAVVMYNFYRWYPNGKILFLAPTRALVDQQMEECSSKMAFQHEHLQLLLGNTPAAQRLDLWNDKRVFFCTPQTVTNDLQEGRCPVNDIKCVVVDEAHKSTGAYAYCTIINQISNANHFFRVIALTATPSNSHKGTQEVVTNLRISRIQQRTRSDLREFVFDHDEQIREVVFDDFMLKIVGLFEQGLKNCISSAKLHGIPLSLDKLSSYQYVTLKGVYEIAKREGLDTSKRQEGMKRLSALYTFYSFYDTLIRFGCRSLYKSLKPSLQGGDYLNEMCKSKKKKLLMSPLSSMYFKSDPTFMQLWKILQHKYGGLSEVSLDTSLVGDDVTSSENINVALSSHPKLTVLKDILLDFFQNNGNCGCIVFSDLRQSVFEITDVLNRFRPNIKPVAFVGKGGGEDMDNTHGTDNKQREALKQFKCGRYNTLVCTCIGEEGLDIGSVDLVVKYNSTKSAIRLQQQTGRTGRRRKGTVVTLLSPGREKTMHESGLANCNRVIDTKNLQMYQPCPSMVPTGIRPSERPQHMNLTPITKSMQSMKQEMQKRRRLSDPTLSLTEKRTLRDTLPARHRQMLTPLRGKVMTAMGDEMSVEDIPVAEYAQDNLHVLPSHSNRSKVVFSLPQSQLNGDQIDVEHSSDDEFVSETRTGVKIPSTSKEDCAKSATIIRKRNMANKRVTKVRGDKKTVIRRGGKVKQAKLNAKIEEESEVQYLKTQVKIVNLHDIYARRLGGSRLGISRSDVSALLDRMSETIMQISAVDVELPNFAEIESIVMNNCDESSEKEKSPVMKTVNDCKLEEYCANSSIKQFDDVIANNQHQIIIPFQAPLQNTQLNEDEAVQLLCDATQPKSQPQSTDSEPGWDLGFSFIDNESPPLSPDLFTDQDITVQPPTPLK